MKKTVLNVVRHQGGLLRLGVVGGEFTELPSKIILREFEGLEGKNAEFLPGKSYYRYGSIYSRELSEWLKRNGYQREAGEDIWLIKAEFSVEAGNAHVFRFIGKSYYVKAPNKNRLRKNGEIRNYKKGELVKMVWEEDNNE